MPFDLNSITEHHPTPPRILIYGEHGVGKTSWGAAAPSPIFIPTEDGLGVLRAKSFPLCRSYQDVLDAIAALYSEKHAFQTIVLDSLDWLEALIWQHVAKEGRQPNIEGFGYGKGYVIAADRMRDILDGLLALRDEKGMYVVLTAHAKVKRFDDPTSEPYDRYQLKLHDRSAGLVAEWADIIGFATQEMAVRREDVGFGQKASRGIAVGGRVLHLSRTPAFDAKHRHGLPNTIPLSWGAFEEALTTAVHAAA